MLEGGGDEGGGMNCGGGSGDAHPCLTFESRLCLVRLRHLVVHGVECIDGGRGFPVPSVVCPSVFSCMWTSSISHQPGPTSSSTD
jgi:hypothetical protein